MYSAGGSHDAGAYRSWIDSFATALGDSSAVVVLEPDAVPHIVDGCTPAQYHDERYGLLAGAIERLKRQPGTRVYLDAGNPAWIDDPGRLVEPLRRAGLARADGFALNVSNFQTNDTVEDFGASLSGLLGGTHFTVDTSRNGAGPLPGDRAEAWCNPPGRSSACRRRSGPGTSWSTRICGSSGPATRTARAGAARRPGSGGRSTPWAWRAGRRNSPPRARPTPGGAPGTTTPGEATAGPLTGPARPGSTSPRTGCRRRR